MLPQRHHFLEARETPPAQALAVSGCRPSVARFPAPPGSGVLGADATELWSPSPSPTCGSRKGRERSEGWPRGGREGAAALPPKLPFYSGVIGVHRLVQPWAKSISLLSDTVAEGKDENARSGKFPQPGPRPPGRHPHPLWPAGPLGRGLCRNKDALKCFPPQLQLQPNVKLFTSHGASSPGC